MKSARNHRALADFWRPRKNWWIHKGKNHSVMGLGFGDEEREKQAQRELAAYCKRGEFASRCRKEKRSDGVQGQGSNDGER